MTGDEPWAFLRRHTAARIAMGRAGDGLPTAPLLRFQAAWAEARDSLKSSLDAGGRAAALAPLGLPVETVRSQAADGAEYLKRPDLGRRLHPDDAARLPRGDWDAVFVIADGLSVRAVEGHAAAVVAAALKRLGGWRIAPLVVAQRARVALADDVGAALGARLTVILIGERPGLSSPDSLGAYITCNPAPGRQNSDRNCISNIRPEGLAPEAAAFKLAWLMAEARRLGLTGVGLKDAAPDLLPPAPAAQEPPSVPPPAVPH
ncbi:ethanolamine ammonia-lyase subunit EutC [Caenispirillum bisanense]|uniref:ethanolamine ammonia-lyase subunit EutC n=1 Tax=Caenispirillum bisanense TaxID=414052 RepID=UPI0031D4F4D5